MHDSAWGRWTCVCAIAAALFAGALVNTAAADEEPSLRKGRRIFQRHCAGCHGVKGQGDGYRLLGPAPADLTSKLIQEKADEDLLRTIHAGKPNMPAWDVILTANDRKHVLAYIRSLLK